MITSGFASGSGGDVGAVLELFRAKGDPAVLAVFEDSWHVPIATIASITSLVLSVGENIATMPANPFGGGGGGGEVSKGKFAANYESEWDIGLGILLLARCWSYWI